MLRVRLRWLQAQDPPVARRVAPEWKPLAARKRAEALRRRVQDGKDPMGERHAQRNAPTVADLWERYETEHLPRKRPGSQRNDRAMAATDILPRLGKMKVAEVRFRDIDRLHRLVSERAPSTANRVAALLSKMFSLAIKWEWRTNNPAKGIERNPEQKRERFLSLDEINSLSHAFEVYVEHSDHPHDTERSVNALRLLILTGARKSEVLAACWEQFDFKTGVWTKPSAHTKQNKEHRAPLSAPALELLKEIYGKQDPPSQWVFPSAESKTGHIVEIKKAWARLCELAELEYVRIHDLRHSFASILVSSGASLPMIGQLLGHTQAQTTARYTHLYDDPLRAATERVGAVVTGHKLAEVVPLNARGRVDD